MLGFGVGRTDVKGFQTFIRFTPKLESLHFKFFFSCVEVLFRILVEKSILWLKSVNNYPLIIKIYPKIGSLHTKDD